MICARCAHGETLWQGASKFEPDIHVTEEAGVRNLWFGTAWEGSMNVADPNSIPAGWQYIKDLRCISHDRTVTTALLIGLGGGSMVRDWLYGEDLVPSLEVLDAVEIDPVVVKLAKHFFNLACPESRLRIITEDGAVFVQQNHGPYDAIILDAFGHGVVPDQFLTATFLTQASKRLKPGGIFAWSIAADPQRTQATTLMQGQFPHVCDHGQVRFGSSGEMERCCGGAISAGRP